MPAQEEQVVVKWSPVVAATADLLAVPGVPAGGASLQAVL